MLHCNIILRCTRNFNPSMRTTRRQHGRGVRDGIKVLVIFEPFRRFSILPPAWSGAFRFPGFNSRRWTRSTRKPRMRILPNSSRNRPSPGICAAARLCSSLLGQPARVVFANEAAQRDFSDPQPGAVQCRGDCRDEPGGPALAPIGERADGRRAAQARTPALFCRPAAHWNYRCFARASPMREARSFSWRRRLPARKT